ncbi:helix-turn-helix transcriptional regulator [Lentilactobacillus senioris]|uniref:helix-turn-helix domain-containing protein n=1 Tax=Lentilactobacillus senioris TaxID=931534 RepID=UPI0022807FC8|nr:helix-turn-helix transcriptional regulator [Lentilactobacillus senioris]MCY9807489.1 helix-turn-helix transcriptional regulator [Lentilactobacillus senioris]
MTIFERTKEIAKKKGFSLQETATKAGLGLNSIYGWKKKDPSISRLEAVAKVLDVSVDELLGKSTDQNNKKNVDLSEPNANDFLSFDGQPISDEDMEIIKRILRGK